MKDKTVALFEIENPPLSVPVGSSFVVAGGWRGQILRSVQRVLYGIRRSRVSPIVLTKETNDGD